MKRDIVLEFLVSQRKELSKLDLRGQPLDSFESHHNSLIVNKIVKIDKMIKIWKEKE